VSAAEDRAVAPVKREYPFRDLSFQRLREEEMLSRGRAFAAEMQARRTVRHFSRDPVPREMVELAIGVAGTAPSGAHQQPWSFVAVSDPNVKRRIREAAEEEERKSYDGRMPAEWLEALAPLGTDFRKEHMTEAPWLVVVFRQAYGIRPDGSKRTHYYKTESVGIAAGFFIAAVHRMGLATLTHTPSPMAFLAAILGRPENEKAFLVMPVGYPAADARVPDLERKPLEAISAWVEGA
jgi:iodotyrosine deiodinase